MNKEEKREMALVTDIFVANYSITQSIDAVVRLPRVVLINKIELIKERSS